MQIFGQTRLSVKQHKIECNGEITNWVENVNIYNSWVTASGQAKYLSTKQNAAAFGYAIQWYEGTRNSK